MDIQQFQDRNEALLSLNEEKIRAYMKKYDIPGPLVEHQEMFWLSVHKAIVLCQDLPPEFRMKSQEYINEWRRTHLY